MALPLAPRIEYQSRLVPRVDALQHELASYAEASQRLHAMAQRYLKGNAFAPEGPPEELLERYLRHRAEYAVALDHTLAVESHTRQSFVLLPRASLSEGSVLHRAPRGSHPKLASTRSLILANSPSTSVHFLPYPSSEVLVFSPILAHSAELQRLSSLGNES